MKLLTGLFRKARKRTQTTDGDNGLFRKTLEEIVEKKADLTEEAVAKKVDGLKEMLADLPESEDKSKLDLYLEDIKSVKEQDEATAKEAVAMVADLFEKLDKEAMENAPEVDGEETTEEVVEEPQTEGEETEVNEVAEETEAPKEDTKDEEPSENYTLEEIYQFIKKRMAEDERSEETVEEEQEEEAEEVVADNAPRISLTMNGTSVARGSLADMFNTLKEGGR